jgi:hypothetical protein
VAMTKKLGRPKKEVGASQTKCVSVWLLEDEKESIQRAANLSRMPVSTWAGKVLTDAARRVLASIGV